MINRIIAGNHYDVLRWLLSTDTSCYSAYNIDEVIVNACKDGNIKLLVSVMGVGISISDAKYSYAAAEHGRIDILTYLHSNGCHFNAWTCTHAALGMHLDVMQYLRSLVDADEDMYWDTNTTAAAAYRGDLAMLKYIRQHNCPWDGEACRLSAYAGHYDITAYLVKHGCQWNVFDI